MKFAMASSLCRVCLVGNIKMLNIQHTHLLEMYEKLSNTTLNAETEDAMPSSLCYVCHRQLQKCYKFSVMAQRSYRKIQDLLHNTTEVTNNALMSLGVTQNLLVTPTKCTSIYDYHKSVTDNEGIIIKEETELNEHIGQFNQTFESTEIDDSNNIEISVEYDAKDNAKCKMGYTEGGLTKRMLDTIAEKPYSCNPPYSESHIPANVDNINTEVVSVTVKKEVVIKEETASNEDIEQFNETFEVTKIDDSNNREISIEYDAKDNDKCKMDVTDGLTKRMLDTTADKPYSSIHMPANVNNLYKESITITVKEEVFDKDTEENDFAKSNDDDSESNNTEISIEQENKSKRKAKSKKSRKSITKSVDVNLYPCDRCDKSFSLKTNLKSHMLVHTGKKAYLCNQCEKAFCRKSDLKKHLLVHTGVKPHSCNRCHKMFSRKGDLTKHMLVHTGERAFGCNECSKTFKVKGNLTRHMIVHTGERPHSCNGCDKTFTRKADLKMHMLGHIGDKLYSCCKCAKTFVLRANLRVHMRTHCVTPSYPCHGCDKKFNEIDVLTNHMLAHIVRE